MTRKSNIYVRKLDLGRPCKRTTSLKNKCATCEASAVLLYGMKCVILKTYLPQ